MKYLKKFLIGLDKIALVGLAVLIFGGGGFWLGQAVCSKKNVEVLTELTRFVSPVSEFSSFIGKVTSVGRDFIIVEPTGFPPDPFRKLPKERRVKITSGTKLIKLVPKAISEYESETEAYSNQQLFLQCSSLGRIIPSKPVILGTPLPPPFPYREEKIRSGDIKIGETVMVEAGEKITNKEEFSAVKIVVQPPESSPSL